MHTIRKVRWFGAATLALGLLAACEEERARDEDDDARGGKSFELDDLGDIDDFEAVDDEDADGQAALGQEELGAEGLEEDEDSAQRVARGTG